LGNLQGRGIALDIPSWKAYYTDNTNGEISKESMGGGGEVYGIVTGIYYPSDIEIDTCAGKMYWYDTHWDQPGNSQIQRSNLDGSNVETLVTSISANNSEDIALDIPNGKIYWTAGDIYRAHLDGTGVEKILTVSASPGGIDLDLSAGKMYWVIWGPDEGRIERANMDGSGKEIIVTGEVVPEGIALDVVAGKVYWSCPWMNPPTIRRANLDGSNVETVISHSVGSSRIRDIELVASPALLTMSVDSATNGTTIPVAGSTIILAGGGPSTIEALPSAGYYFSGWSACPAAFATFGDSAASSTTVTLEHNATVTANFAPLVDLTMEVSPSGTGATTPDGASGVIPGVAISIEAQANSGYGFVSWTAVPSENVVFGNANASSTTATLSGNATVTANFNARPVADINATVNVLVIADANSVTLDATGSTDDGIPDPPGIMTYHWKKVSGPNTCSILDPNEAITEVSFWGLGSYEFSVTVSDGQLQDIGLATVDVVVEVSYVANDGNDNTGLGTIENPFATVQKGIDMVQNNGTVIVMPGTYYETISFAGKKACVRSSNPDDPNIVANTVIDANSSGTVVTFSSAEDANSILSGFKITGGNTADGGGIYIKDSSPVVEKNIITGNYASNIGSGLYAENSFSLVRFNTIVQNDGYWGTVFFKDSNCSFINNIIAHNLNDYDAGLYCDGGEPYIKNNTIADNTTRDTIESSTGIGFGWPNPNTSPTIINNILGVNVNGFGVCDWTGNDANCLRFNNVYGHSNGNYAHNDQTGINGNISVDPLFTNIDANNYQLLSGSLLIDAGDPNSVWGSEQRPNGGRINLGAYGNTSEAACSLAGDITWDKKVDFKDFAKLAFYWLQNEPSVDIAPLISGDNIVDEEDLVVLAEHWLEGVLP